MRALLTTAILVAASAAMLPAEQSPPAGSRVTTQHTCAAPLGSGVKTRRPFCDVITGTPAESISVVIPARTGTATLLFDLHNRFGVPALPGYPGVSYARHEAIVKLVRADGTVIGRAAIIREFRSTADLFDQLAGGAAGGVKGVAPGPPEAVRFAIPTGVTTVGIVGERLRVRTGTGSDETYDAPGRPIAIVSNIRLDYRSR